MVQFLSINFFSWISSIFVGFFKISRFFFVSFCIILDSDQRNAHALFYNIFLTFLYMFRALYAHHQEVELY